MPRVLPRRPAAPPGTHALLRLPSLLAGMCLERSDIERSKSVLVILERSESVLVILERSERLWRLR